MHQSTRRIFLFPEGPQRTHQQAQPHAHHNARQFAEDVAHGAAWHQASSGNGAPGGLGGMEAELAMSCKTTSPALLAL